MNQPQSLMSTTPTRLYNLQIRNWSVPTKLIVAMTLLSLVSLVLLATTASVMTSRELEQQLSDRLVESAGLEGERVGNVLFDQLNILRAAVSSDPAIIDALQTSNAAYTGNAAEIEAQLLVLDKQWRSAGDGSNPLIERTLDNQVSNQLQLFIKQFPAHAEVFITDRYGAEIGGSGRTSDYYQADEDWWQAGWNNAKGAVIFGSPRLDESTGVVAIEISMPIYAPNGADVIGILKAVYNINALIADTAAFKFGQTGTAQIVDKNSQYVVGPTAESIGKPVGDNLTLQGRMLQGKGFDLDTRSATGNRVVIGYAPIATTNRSPEITSLGWVMRVEQDYAEAFLPITQLQTSAAIFTLIGALIAAIVARWLARALTQDLKTLTQASTQLSIGNLKARANVTNQDEIGKLAIRFNQMADAIEDRIKDVEQARERAERSDQVKSAFLASMSHELRTPLNAVINFTRFVIDGDTGPVNEEQTELLTEVVSSAKHLLNLINDVLDMSKIEAGSLNLFVEDDVDLKTIVNSVVTTGRALLAGKPTRLKTEIEDNLPLIRADRQRVLQILLNIMSNACKFTEEGDIAVKLKQQNGEFLISISDTGPGIAPEDQAMVFEAFKQTKTGLRQGGGTGLGMPIAKNLAEAHGGRLWLESEYGKGATFYVALPIKSEVLVPMSA